MECRLRGHATAELLEGRGEWCLRRSSIKRTRRVVERCPVRWRLYVVSEMRFQTRAPTSAPGGTASHARHHHSGNARSWPRIRGSHWFKPTMNGYSEAEGLGCLLCVCQGHDKNSWSHQLNGAEQMMMIRFQRPQLFRELRGSAAAHTCSRTLSCLRYFGTSRYLPQRNGYMPVEALQASLDPCDVERSVW